MNKKPIVKPVEQGQIEQPKLKRVYPPPGKEGLRLTQEQCEA